jgi:16S rRNA pseudouridine516 synthase
VAARRLDQLLSSLGYCSRKEAQALCDAGRLTVDGRSAEDASQRVTAAAVQLDGAALDPEILFVRLHKPVGFVCSHDDRDGRLVYELLPPRWFQRDPKLVTIGRLDKDTSGLVLLTDVGAWVQRFTSPKHHVDKVYEAELDGPVTAEHIAHFAAGVALEEGVCLPAVLHAAGPTKARVTVREGKYHQVRRMFAAVGRHVHALHRVSFGSWGVDDLEVGAWEHVPPPR